MTRDIPALTGLRGLAALWVFAFHAAGLADGSAAYGPLQRITGAGDMGVDVFFVLSGFVLALNYPAVHRSAASWRSFLWKRLARIYPVHFACLGALGVVTMTGLYAGRERLGNISDIVTNLTLTHGWSVPIVPSWNPVSWSISCEWLAYLAFPLIAVMAAELKRRRDVIFLIVFLSAALHLVSSRGEYSGTMPYGLIRIAFDFPVGVLAYRLYEMNRERGVKWDRVALAAGVVLVVALTLLFPLTRKRELLGAACVLSAVLIYALARSDGRLANALSRPFWQYAGHVSYSFYMVHILILTPVYQHVRPFTGGLLSIPLGFALTAAAAHLMYIGVEQPMRRRMLAWYEGRGRPSRPLEAEEAVPPSQYR